MKSLFLSQSPQTGQVYFNADRIAQKSGLVPMKSQSPQTGQVYFNILQGFSQVNQEVYDSLNPLKRVKFISIKSGLVPLQQQFNWSQSPQTGQVYFNILHQEINNIWNN